MILDYYNLREQPFGVTPDPRYFYASNTHREALASLLYGIESGRGFLALVAQPGMGKTTLIFRCLAQMQGKLRSAFLFQTICTPLDFLRLLLTDLGVKDVSGGVAELQSKLIQFLMEQSPTGTKLVIVVDEAQNLDNSVLEFIRMLSNFETAQQKLMHIILCGQPQLARKLASPELIQLRQRISIIAHLDPLSPEQTAAYVNERLEVAGRSSQPSLFDESAMQLIAVHSAGLPRNINNLCFNALSLGCVLRKPTIDAEVIREVILDLGLDRLAEEPIAVPLPEPLPLAHEPIRSSQPTWPVQQAEPVRPAEPIQPAEAIQLTQPIDSAEPRSMRFAWIPTAVAASVLMLAMGGVAGPAHTSAGIRSVRATSVAPPPAPAAALTAVPTAAPPPASTVPATSVMAPVDPSPAPVDTIGDLTSKPTPKQTVVTSSPRPKAPKLVSVPQTHPEDRYLMPAGLANEPGGSLGSSALPAPRQKNSSRSSPSVSPPMP